MKARQIIFAAISIGLLNACLAKEERAKPVEISNAQRASSKIAPIVQVEHYFNHPASRAFSNVLDSLKQRNINIAGMSESNGQIETRWTPIRDHICENGIRSTAPVSCKVRFHFNIKALTPVASSYKGRYQELCNFNEDILVECPNSNAERLLKTISQEVASAR